MIIFSYNVTKQIDISNLCLVNTRNLTSIYFNWIMNMSAFILQDKNINATVINTISEYENEVFSSTG